ncbi:hypothetical protein H0H87_012452 [Tephrocybe sp. NHM501043]|nr:hypothetical protein H0H87_012452 [Tephrocybe sp. NHM501043]
MNSNSLRNYITSVAFEGDILTLLQAFVSSSTKDVPAEAAILLLHMLKTTTVPPQAHASGFSPETMRHLSDTRRLAHQLRDVCASQVAINAEEAKAIDDAWSAAHAQQTRAWAEDALYRARNAIKETRHLNEQYVKGKKQVFNHRNTSNTTLIPPHQTGLYSRGNA